MANGLGGEQRKEWGRRLGALTRLLELEHVPVTFEPTLGQPQRRHCVDACPVDACPEDRLGIATLHKGMMG